MKELYISPEVELIGFIAAERMASMSGNVDFDDMDGEADYGDDFGSGSDDSAQSAPGDIHLPFPKF